MPAGGGLTLFHVRGIRIAVDYTWFFVVFLIILWLSGFYRAVLDTAEDATGPYLLALASALLFFASILLHELGHALVGIRRGVRISEITLWMFGGVARMDRDSDSPTTEFKVAIAGPLVTLAIVAAGGGAGAALAGSEHGFWDAILVREGAETSGALAMVAWLTTINALLLAFNLLPAYPLDGGRIARAIAWWRTGDRAAATRFASRLGQGFSWVLIAVGAFWLVQGNVIGGIWLAVLGFILGRSAQAAAVQVEVTRRIGGLTVADVMDAEPVAIPERVTVDRALDEYFLRYRWPWFPVVDAAQRLRGLLERSVADAVPELRRASATVGEVVPGKSAEGIRVAQDEPLESLLGNQELRRLGALMAVDSDGRLQGVITVDQVGRALKAALTRPTGEPGSGI